MLSLTLLAMAVLGTGALLPGAASGLPDGGPPDGVAAAPVVEAIPDIDTDIGVTNNFTANATDDGTIVSYEWDFGDGSTSSLMDTSHAWYTDGPHSCSLNVTDDEANSTVVSFWVNVTDVAPTAAFTVYSPRNEGQTVTVNGASTTEPGNDIVSWEWDWESDGTFDNTTGPVSQTIYWKPGYYNITLRVTDGEGSTNETVREVLIRNVVPTAACTINPRSVVEGDNVTFDCSGSSEPGDDIVRYYFDWDGDSVYDFNTTEAVVNHTYTHTGAFTTRVMVEDEDGTFDDYSQGFWSRVTVSNKPPLVNASTSYGVEGELTNVSCDVDEPGNDIVEYGWDFDGDYEPDVITNVSWVNWIFWKAGTSTVWVKATDEDDTEANPSWGGGEIDVIITDVAPKPSVESGQATEGEPTPFTVVMLGTEENISLFQFDLNGDNEFEVSSTTWTTDLTFTDTGELECLVRVVDTDGTEGIAIFNVYVHDVAPTVYGPDFFIVAEGETLTVVVTVTEPGMDLVKYEFDWNADGAADETTTEPTASHSYGSPGTKQVVISAIDEDGSKGSSGFPVLVTNTPPTADAGTPAQSYEGEMVELNASLSTEPGNNIVSYEWDYEADGLFDFATREPAHEHAWDAPGVYSVVVRVIDQDGTYDEDTATVVVEDKEPVAALSVTVMPEDEPSMLDASMSTDPGGIALYEWNISATGQRVDASTTVPYLSFPFDRAVRYEIKLTVTDDEGNTATAQHVVAIDDTITNPPTVTYLAPTLVMEGSMFTVRAWAEDPFPDDPELLASRLIEYSWDMGDGSAVLKGDTVSHAYAKAAFLPYTVTLTVVDEDNDRVTLMVANISVINPPPEISPIPPIIVNAGGKGESTVTASDGTTSSSELVVELDPNAPEWITLTGTTVKAEPGKGVDPATYLATVTVTDELGASTSAQMAVVVAASESAESGVSMGTLLGVMVLFLVIAIVVAVLVSSRMRPPGGAAKDGPSKGKEYQDLYGEEPRRRKVRAQAKVDTEQVAVSTESPEALDFEAATSASVAASAPPPAAAPAEEPPLPSWMSSSKEQEVRLEERQVARPPATPEEWESSNDDGPVQTYAYRRPTEGQEKSFKGAGRPRQ